MKYIALILLLSTNLYAGDWYADQDTKTHEWRVLDGHNNRAGTQSISAKNEKTAKKLAKDLNKIKKKEGKNKDKKEDFMNGEGCDNPLITC